MTVEHDDSFSSEIPIDEVAPGEASDLEVPTQDAFTRTAALEILRVRLQERLATLRTETEDAERRAFELQNDSAEIFAVREDCRKIEKDEREDLQKLREEAREESLERCRVIVGVDHELATSVEGMAAQVAARADRWLVAEAETVAPSEAWSRTLAADRDRLRLRVSELNTWLEGKNERWLRGPGSAPSDG